jgi:hypothetical protein
MEFSSSSNSIIHWTKNYMKEHDLINNSQQLQWIIINSTSQDLGNRDCQNGFKMTTNQKMQQIESNPGRKGASQFFFFEGKMPH